MIGPLIATNCDCVGIYVMHCVDTGDCAYVNVVFGISVGSNDTDDIVVGDVNINDCPLYVNVFDDVIGVNVDVDVSGNDV